MTTVDLSGRGHFSNLHIQYTSFYTTTVGPPVPLLRPKNWVQMLVFEPNQQSHKIAIIISVTSEPDHDVIGREDTARHGGGHEWS